MIVTPEQYELFPYQREGVEFLLNSFNSPARGAILADDMGLGKTAQAIVAAASVGAKRILVICPAIMRETWRREFQVWHKHIDDYRLTVIEKSKDRPYGDNTAKEIVVCSYNYATSTRGIGVLTRWFKYDLVIADEYHYCKNWRAQRTIRTVRTLMRPDVYKIACTGTPVTSRVVDLHPQLFPFLRESLPKFQEFGARYSYAKHNGFSIVYTGIKNAEELKDLTRPVLIRRRKKKILTQLPQKTYKNVYIPINKNLAKKSLNYVDSVITTITGEDHQTKEQIDDEGHIATVRQKLGIAKCKGAVEYIKELLETEEKIVVFAYHTQVVEILSEALKELDIKHKKLVGSMTPSDKQTSVDEFQTGDVRVIVANILAAGVGITLTSSSQAVFVELDWTPANMLQAVDRVHRIGQNEQVQIHFLLAAESLDEDVVKVIKQKMKVISEAM